MCGNIHLYVRRVTGDSRGALKQNVCKKNDNYTRGCMCAEIIVCP